MAMKPPLPAKKNQIRFCDKKFSPQKTMSHTRLFFVLILLLISSLARADRIFVTEGNGRTRNGKIVSMTRNEVIIESGVRAENVPVPIIAYTVFDDDPPRLMAVRTALAAQRYREARDDFAKLTLPANASAFAQQDYRFISLSIEGNLAIEDSANAVSQKQISSRIFDFLREYPENYHYDALALLASELAQQSGDATLRLRGLEMLQTSAQAAYKTFAALALCDAALARGEIETARTLAQNLINETDFVQKLRAEIILARCLAAEEKFAESETALEVIIAAASQENIAQQEKNTLCATAFNTLGDLLQKKNQNAEAALAYLHVEILYSGARREWLYAMEQLESLWRKLGNPDRAAATAAKRAEGK